MRKKDANMENIPGQEPYSDLQSTSVPHDHPECTAGAELPCSQTERRNPVGNTVTNTHKAVFSSELQLAPPNLKVGPKHPGTAVSLRRPLQPSS